MAEEYSGYAEACATVKCLTRLPVAQA